MILSIVEEETAIDFMLGTPNFVQAVGAIALQHGFKEFPTAKAFQQDGTWQKKLKVKGVPGDLMLSAFLDHKGEEHLFLNASAVSESVPELNRANLSLAILPGELRAAERNLRAYLATLPAPKYPYLA